MNYNDKALLLKTKHTKYLRRHIEVLPSLFAAFDSTRLTVAFFALSGLDVLNTLDALEAKRKSEIIEWIYSLQVTPNEDDTSSWDRCGFLGSKSLEIPMDNIKENNAKEYRCGHIAMTYTGLASLLILGDDLSRVNKKAIIKGLRALQQDDGSFCATLNGSESDMRFIYCAASISYILNDWSGIDVEKAADFIKKSMSYDFGIGQGPDLESHAGPTFCAVASLSLMKQLHSTFTECQVEGLKRWALRRQTSGFQGRPNKPEDTCYSFWVGATLKLLDVFHFVNPEKLREFILSTQDSVTGGFSKWVDSMPDPLHTYFGLCGLSFMEEKELVPIHPALNMTLRAHTFLKGLHVRWYRRSIHNNTS